MGLGSLRRVTVVVMLATIGSCGGGSNPAADPTTPQVTVPDATTTVPSEDSTTTSSGDASDATDAPGVRWQSELLQLKGWVTVPLDRDDPDGPTIEVPIYQHKASDPDRRIGVLLVNPGGPGVPALWMAEDARDIFSAELVDRFDIVAWNPRGTFRETAVSCLDAESFTDLVTGGDGSPDQPGEIELLDERLDALVDECADRNGEMLTHVSTVDTAHDMAAIVRALGEEEVSYLGFSYGTTLGAAFATLYPELVRAAVLDAAYHPYGDPVDVAIAQAAGYEKRLEQLYATCDTDPECPIADDTRTVFERVAARADVGPLSGDPSLPPVNQEVLFSDIFRTEAAYSDGPPTALFEAIAAADAGDATALQQMFVELVEFQTDWEANTPINCIDWPYRGRSPLPPDLPERLAGVAPLMSALFPPVPAEYRTDMGDICERWPVGPELLPQPLDAAGSGPILVVAATGDAVTPPGSAELLAEELQDARLLYVQDNRHGSYNASPESQHVCATETVDAFLTDVELPPDRTTCAADGE
jgi:pimeloyl-ACP methyl ester carboxylesterase